MDTTPSSGQPEGPIGPTVAIGIVILLLLAGGVYFILSAKGRLHRTPIQQNVSV